MWIKYILMLILFLPQWAVGETLELDESDSKLAHELALFLDFNLMPPSVQKTISERIKIALKIKKKLEKKTKTNICAINFEAIFNPERPNMYIFYTNNREAEYYETSPANLIEEWSGQNNIKRSLFRIPQYEVRVSSLHNYDRKTLCLEGIPLVTECPETFTLNDGKININNNIIGDSFNFENLQFSYITKFQMIRLVSVLIKYIESFDLESKYSSQLKTVKKQVRLRLKDLYQDIENKKQQETSEPETDILKFMINKTYNYTRLVKNN